MVRRLVLGCGAHGHAVIGGIADSPDDLVVVDPDGGRVEALRDEGIDARRADPADPSVLANLDEPDTVVIAGDDPDGNHAVAITAREAYPDACLVAYAGDDPDPESRAALADHADRVVDAGAAMAAALQETVGSQTGSNLWELKRLLRGVDGRLGVFMHDNPDPDAIASAIALRAIAKSAGVPADACYYGEISHQENRAFVNLLDLDLVHLDPHDEVDYAAVALVDHSRPGVNDQLPPETPVDVLIDHHPPRDAVEARFVDLRSDVGATSTLLADYFRHSGTDPGRMVATALLYGIRVDTRDFSREITRADFDAAAFLLPRVDADVLDRIESPSLTATTLDTIAAAIANRHRRGSVLVSSVGRLADRDALAQAADRLLTIDGITTTLVYGFTGGTVYASARARGTDLDVGEAMREAFDQIGSAGGHDDMAGAQLPIGILGDVEGEAEEALAAAVESVITNRFFEVVGPNDGEGSSPSAPEPDDEDGAPG